MMKNGKRYLLVAIALLLATVMFSGLAMAADEEAPKPIKEIKLTDTKTDYEVELKGKPIDFTQAVAYTLDPADADPTQYVEWTSDDEDIATIDTARIYGSNKAVVVRSVKPGKVTITGVAKDHANKPIAGVKEVKFTVNFKEVEAKELNFDTYSKRITLVGANSTGTLGNLLQPKILPTTATYSSLKYEKLAWTSEDPTTLLVTEGGNYKALKLGKVKVTATTTVGSKKLTNTAEIEIYQDPIKSVSFVPTAFEIEANKALPLDNYLKKEPADAVAKATKWTSSDPEIFSAPGFTAGTKAGTVTVTVEILNYDGTTVTASCTVTVKPVALKALSFVKSSLTLKQNQDQINLMNYLKKDPLDVTLRADDLCWESSNPQVVAVDGNGNLTVKGTGSATISIFYKDNPAIEASIEVIVTNLAVNNVRFDRKAVTLYFVAKPESKEDISTSKDVGFTVEPKDAFVKYVNAETSNAKVAVAEDVSLYGGCGNVTIKAVGKGKCKITVYVNDGETNYTAQLKVTVTDKGPSAKLNYKNLTLKVGKKATLVAKDTNKLKLAGKWSSSDKSIAKVNKKGVVKAKAPGRCVITFTPKSKSIRPISCQVKVVK